MAEIKFTTLISEISKDILNNPSNKIRTAVANLKQRPMNNLFKGRDRFIVKSYSGEFVKAAKVFGLNPDNFDMENGFYLTPEGKKERFGAVIKPNTPEEKRDAKKLKHILQQRNAYTFLLFSRHPIDVLRMSDVGGISSCHSVGGSHFRSALDECRNQGAIVYELTKEDAKFVQENIHKDDIFEDDDRDIRGAYPLTRVRLRRLIDLTKLEDYALPEIRYYREDGNTMGHEGRIVDVVTKYCRENQPLPEFKGNFGNFVYVGGVYSDNSMVHLLENLLGKKLVSAEDYAELDGGNMTLDKLKIRHMTNFQLDSLLRIEQILESPNPEKALFNYIKEFDMESSDVWKLFGHVITASFGSEGPRNMADEHYQKGLDAVCKAVLKTGALQDAVSKLSEDGQPQYSEYIQNIIEFAKFDYIDSHYPNTKRVYNICLAIALIYRSVDRPNPFYRLAKNVEAPDEFKKTLNNIFMSIFRKHGRTTAYAMSDSIEQFLYPETYKFIANPANHLYGFSHYIERGFRDLDSLNVEGSAALFSLRMAHVVSENSQGRKGELYNALMEAGIRSIVGYLSKNVNSAATTKYELIHYFRDITSLFGSYSIYLDHLTDNMHFGEPPYKLILDYVTKNDIPNGDVVLGNLLYLISYRLIYYGNLPVEPYIKMLSLEKPWLSNPIGTNDLISLTNLIIKSYSRGSDIVDYLFSIYDRFCPLYSTFTRSTLFDSPVEALGLSIDKNLVTGPNRIYRLNLILGVLEANGMDLPSRNKDKSEEEDSEEQLEVAS